MPDPRFIGLVHSLRSSAEAALGDLASPLVTPWVTLVGHDLIWCLYCDWMTGVYSLGAEMLRNVESFWCPIRFYDGKKCENCRIDFPDVDGGWVAADGTMADVTRVMDEQYPEGAVNRWFGHPARLTVNGEEPDPTPDRATS